MVELSFEITFHVVARSEITVMAGSDIPDTAGRKTR